MIEKEKFRMYQDEADIAADKAKSETITIRMNPKEKELLLKLKRLFNVHMDSKAIKLSMEVSHNVLQSFLGSQVMSYLTSKSRRREEIE